jgi:hypothetical protein
LARATGSVGGALAIVIVSEPSAANFSSLASRLTVPILVRPFGEYAVSGRRRYDQCEMESTPQDDKAASRLAPKSDDGRFDLCVAMNGRRDWLDLE